MGEGCNIDIVQKYGEEAVILDDKGEIFNMKNELKKDSGASRFTPAFALLLSLFFGFFCMLLL